jgi:hypothetical protein
MGLTWLDLFLVGHNGLRGLKPKLAVFWGIFGGKVVKCQNRCSLVCRAALIVVNCCIPKLEQRSREVIKSVCVCVCVLVGGKKGGANFGNEKYVWSKGRERGNRYRVMRRCIRRWRQLEG